MEYAPDRPWYMRLHWQVLIAMALGITVGLLPGGEVVEAYVGWVGRLFMRLLRMIILPLVITSIVSGVASAGSGRTVGRLFGKTLLYYLASSLLAALTGLLLFNLINPGRGYPVTDTGAPPPELSRPESIEDLINTISLEDFCAPWPQNPPSFRLKRNLLEKVADISRLLHSNGVNHRDYYICHFLLKIPDGIDKVDPDNFHIHLIDLHRSQIRQHTPKRWIRKDIAAIYFSALDIGLTRHDVFRFIKVYTGLPLRQALVEYDWLWQGLQEKSQKLYIRKQRKGDL